MRLNLVTGLNAINALCKSAIWHDLTISEQGNILKIYDTLNIIMHVQKRWLQGEKGILWQYEVNGTDTKLTQNHLLNEARKAQLDSFYFVERILKKLNFDLLNPKGLYHCLNDYSALIPTLEKIKECIKATLLVNKQWKISKNTYDLKEYNMYYDNTLHVFQLLMTLKARYLPTVQCLDALQGLVYHNNKFSSSEGVCWGYLGDWSLSIKKYGKHIYMQRINPQVIKFQEGDAKIFETAASCSFASPMELWGYIEEIFTDLDSLNTYAILFTDKIRGHAMGIRIIPLTQEVEFYDPNFAIIIFPDMCAFKTWFAHLYNFNYYEYFPKGEIKLKKLYTQPYDASPTIPKLRVSSFKVTNKELWLPEYTKYGDDTFNFIENFVASFHYWGQITQSQFTNDIENELMKTRISHLAKYINSRVIKPESMASVQLLHNTLKKNTLHVIHQEQYRLMRQIINPWNIIRKLKALDNLKICIKLAPTSITLKVAIDRWLAQKNTKGQSHRDVISAPRLSIFKKKTATLACIQHLLKHYEINPFILCVMQDMVFMKVYEVLRHINSIHSPIFMTLFELIHSYDPSKDDVLSILVQIKETIAVSILPSSPSSFLKFYDAIANLQPLDPSSLSMTYCSLKQF